MSLLGYDDKKLNLGDGIMAATQEDNWDFFKKSVERAAFPDTIASPQSTLILAGPATYEEIAPVRDEVTGEQDLLTPVGFVDDITYAEGQNIQKFGEIGSAKSRTVIDRTAASGNISRAMFNASTLQYVLYQNSLKSTSARKVDDLYGPPMKSSGAEGLRYKFGSWGEMTRIPFGMAICFRTLGNDFLASVFLEQCYLGDYEIGQTIGQALVMEKVRFEFAKVRAVKIKVEGSSIGATVKDTGSKKRSVGNGANYPT